MGNELCLCSIEGLLNKLRRAYYRESGLEGSNRKTLGSGRDNMDNLNGEEGSRVVGVNTLGSPVREMTPALRERGLIKQMEEEVATAGLGE